MTVFLMVFGSGLDGAGRLFSLIIYARCDFAFSNGDRIQTSPSARWVAQDFADLRKDMRMEGTYEEWLAKVAVDGKELRNVPAAFMTEELCLAAVKDWGIALQFAPDSVKSPEVCRAAVEHWSVALQYVPEALRTPELCLHAVTNDQRLFLSASKLYLIL